MATVMVIDDDRLQRTAAAYALGKSGHDVIEAGDGAEGMRLAAERRPDLVVCDVVMPEVNGYQFLAWLRNEPELARTPLILLTSLAERSQVRLGMTSGADDYITKPYSFAELREAVDSLLRRQAPQAEPFPTLDANSRPAPIDLAATGAAAANLEAPAPAPTFAFAAAPARAPARAPRPAAPVTSAGFSKAMLVRCESDASESAEAAARAGDIARRLFEAEGAFALMPHRGGWLAVCPHGDAEGDERAALKAALAGAFAYTSRTAHTRAVIHRGLVSVAPAGSTGPQMRLAGARAADELAQLATVAAEASWPVSCSLDIARAVPLWAAARGAVRAVDPAGRLTLVELLAPPRDSM
ncbi:response regulator transcription factor [Ramlibacter sp.]|uniref:response regulator transcription factor n=1 Tax=Ramlibacter sp. TaxID=1917967 RepID=UPI003D1151EC